MTPTVAAFALLAGPAADAVRPADASALVRQLASESFRLREEAARQLVRLGPDARAALAEGMRHRDPEVADRCRRLLPAAMDHHARLLLEKLLADPELPLPDELPGAARWKKLAGDTKESRKLYVELAQHHRQLLTLLEREPARLAEEYRNFCLEASQRTRFAADGRLGTITRPELLLFLFLGSDPVRGKTALSAQDYTAAYPFLNQSALPAALSGSDGPSEPLKKLFVAWLEHERNTLLVRRAFLVASNAGLKEAIPVGLKHVADKTLPASTRATALLCVARLGGPELIKEVEPLLSDETLVVTVRFGTEEQMTVELRDVALASCLLLAKQKPIEFGFERDRSAALATSYTYYGFTTDEKRAAAHRKWKEWWAAQQKK